MIMDPSYKEDMIEQLNSLTDTDKNKLPDSIENLLKDKTMTENLWCWYQKDVEEYKCDPDFAIKDAIQNVIHVNLFTM